MEDRDRAPIHLPSSSTILHLPTEPDVASRAPLEVASWGIFLAASWTWCIGMFLPVLMVRDHGIAGFLVFALPNMIGAAAMGRWVVSADQSRRLTADHGAACAAFSAVTILFHAFFVVWVIQSLIGHNAVWITLAAAVGMLLLAGGDGATRVVAAGVFSVSVTAFALALARNGMGPIVSTSHARPLSELFGLATVCTFGFAFCPYLDLTFHRARRATAPAVGRAAFAVGFLVFFPVMILFTLWYAPHLAPRRWSILPRPIAWIIAVHLMIQTALTVALHARALARRLRGPGPALGVIIGLVAPTLLIACVRRLHPPHIGADPGELAYRLFMSFYALPFPAYVWLCMLPMRQSAPPTPRHLIAFAVACLITAPLFWLSFLENRLMLLLPAVALLLLARLTAPRSTLAASQDALTVNA